MNEFRYDYLLPIGSIVKLKEIKQRVMIIGVLQQGQDSPDQIYDYAVVPYPEGLHDTHLNIGVYHSNIEEVVFRGYEDKERQAFLVLLEAMARRKEGLETEETP